MKVITVLGTRPEIIKMSPVIQELEEDGSFDHKIIHTGQHYDWNMSFVFFEELNLKPNYLLAVGSHPRERQIELMREKIKSKFEEEKPDLVIVQGDTNSTLAGAYAASDLNIPIMHIEAGCRSFNKSMPEEINRIEVDRLSDYLITPDSIALNNLKNEGFVNGVGGKTIFNCGSTAYDTVQRNVKNVNNSIINEHNLQNREFILVTIHRSENTNDVGRLGGLIGALNEIAQRNILVFPVHPRTEKILKEHKITLNSHIKVIPPASYFHFLALLSNCKFCMSDSGGIQEEALALGKPCFILRDETEWTRITNMGRNILIGTNPQKIISFIGNLSEDKLNEIKEKPIEFYLGASKDIVKKIKSIRDHIKLTHPTADVSLFATIGANTRIWHQVQVREGATIGENNTLGKNVYVDKNVIIGKNCKIQNNSSIYHGVTLEDGVFIGPHCVLTNDKHPRAIGRDGKLRSDSDWIEGKILVKEGASLGARVVVLPDVTIGRFALVGAGSVVTKDVPDFGLVYGNPACLQGYVCACGRRIDVQQTPGKSCSYCKALRN